MMRYGTARHGFGLLRLRSATNPAATTAPTPKLLSRSEYVDASRCSTDFVRAGVIEIIGAPRNAASITKKSNVRILPDSFTNCSPPRKLSRTDSLVGFATGTVVIKTRATTITRKLSPFSAKLYEAPR